MSHDERKITTPNPGERALYEGLHAGVHVTQLPDDPIALRVSLGEAPGGASAYLVHRGPRHGVVALLKRALAAMEEIA